MQKPPYIIYSNRAVAIYEALDIRKERIDPGQPWQNYIESHLYVMWNLENSLHNLQYLDALFVVTRTYRTYLLPPFGLRCKL
jgi:hypothetical protein